MVGTVSKHPDRCFDGERVTGARIAVSWDACLACVNSAAIGIFAPVETIVQPNA